MTPRHALRRGRIYLVDSRTLAAVGDEAVWAGDRFIGAYRDAGGWRLVEVAHADDGGDVTVYQEADEVDARIPLTTHGLEGLGSCNRALLRALLSEREDADDFWRGPQALPEGYDADYDEYEHLLNKDGEADEDADITYYSGRPC